ncbi:MAG TPA: hypothetical protein ENI51_06530 [Candidatus Atribacteria bacterium]|nr:hypothetical protein [Candidatus Atribacteria bacterium]
MKIISFAWTSEAFKAGRKTVTRRKWSHEYAQRFKKGDICQAFDRQPRYGGKRIGYLKIVKDLYWECISDMPDSDFEAEGFAFMKEQKLKIWGEKPEIAFANWKKTKDYYWVIRFKKIDMEDLNGFIF